MHLTEAPPPPESDRACFSLAVRPDQQHSFLWTQKKLKCWASIVWPEGHNEAVCRLWWLVRGQPPQALRASWLGYRSYINQCPSHDRLIPSRHHCLIGLIRFPVQPGGISSLSNALENSLPSVMENHGHCLIWQYELSKLLISFPNQIKCAIVWWSELFG